MGEEILTEEDSSVSLGDVCSVEKEHLVKSTTYSIQDEERALLREEVTDPLEETADEVSRHVNPNNKIYYEIFFVVMPVFCGYAALFSMQSEVEQAIYGDVEQEPHIFGFACSMLYMGNLVFRLGHNIIFAFTGPRWRVVISMISMILSMATILSIFMFFNNNPAYVAFVFLGYGLGGVAIGTFEANVLSMVTVLGKDTKLWAIIAIPVGVNFVNIGGYALLAVWDWLYVHPGGIQFFVLLYCIVGLVVLRIRIFGICKQAKARFTIKEFFRAFLFWRDWLWKIKWNCLALLFDMFCVSLFSPGVILYIYNQSCVPFYAFGYEMNRDWFIALYNTFFFFGDTSSRKIFYTLKLINPMWFLLYSALGIFFGLLDITALVFFCALFVAFANGSMYTQTNRYIDKNISSHFNLIAISFWLFIGDIGSVVGSNIISYLSDWFQDIYGIYSC